METTSTPTTKAQGATSPARCSGTDRHGFGLGCARSAGHSGACWLTGRPAEARADLLRNGISGR